MKTVALLALIAGIAAATTGIVFQTIRIRKAGKADKWTTWTIVFSAIFIVVAIVNLILVIPNL